MRDWSGTGGKLACRRRQASSSWVDWRQRDAVDGHKNVTRVAWRGAQCCMCHDCIETYSVEILTDFVTMKQTDRQTDRRREWQTETLPCTNTWIITSFSHVQTAWCSHHNAIRNKLMSSLPATPAYRPNVCCDVIMYSHRFYRPQNMIKSSTNKMIQYEYRYTLERRQKDTALTDALK